MAHPNVDLLRKGYDAFTNGDLDTIRNEVSCQGTATGNAAPCLAVSEQRAPRTCHVERRTGPSQAFPHKPFPYKPSGCRMRHGRSMLCPTKASWRCSELTPREST